MEINEPFYVNAILLACLVVEKRFLYSPLKFNVSDTFSYIYTLDKQIEIKFDVKQRLFERRI